MHAEFCDFRTPNVAEENAYDIIFDAFINFTS